MKNKEITKHFISLSIGVTGLIFFVVIRNMNFTLGEFQGQDISTSLFGLSMLLIGFSTASLKYIALNSDNAINPDNTNIKKNNL